MSYHTTLPEPPLWLRMNAGRYTPDQVLTHFGMGRPPVDVYAIVSGLGAELHFVSGAKWDAAVDSKETGEARIFVNTNTSEVRRRFSAAHEVGHLLLHKPGRAFRDDFSGSGLSIDEIQANNFAANLLMPSWMISAYTKAGVPVGALAQQFRVSAEAMKYRLEKLGYNVHA